MLRIIQNSSSAGAKTYFSTADYYSEGHELVGLWRGEGAKRLDLGGVIRHEQWDALCDNIDPRTGTPLTQRTKSERRVGYDFTFSVPKGVSLLYAVSRDPRLVDAIRNSVDATMEDIEAEMKTRVRTDGQDTDRMTGNMVWGQYIHTTGRPVDGEPDPQLHAHCFVFNATWDQSEQRWKAGQFAGIKRDAPFFEAVFHSRLARRLEELGLPVERTRHGWDLADVPLSATKKFSRRSEQIEKLAREMGITDPDAKGELGAKTRERKQKDLRFEELQERWKSRMTADELAALQVVKSKLGKEAIGEDNRIAGEAVTRAVEHCFERSSVVAERTLMAQALKRSVGAASPETTARAMKTAGLIGAVRNERQVVTTESVLAEERRMIRFAREGRGSCRKLGTVPHAFKETELNEGQRRAVEHVLDSRDRVILVRGAAGVGKTWMMREAVAGIQDGGHQVFVFAPSADASRGVLRTEGFADADTVARLLKDEKMQAAIHGQVVWIDEAGLLGTRTMARVFDLAEKQDARIVLSGDRWQHGSVERGAALRLLEERAGLKSAELREIQRQTGDYRDAVQALSEGRVEDGFQELDRLGWIKEVSDTDRYKMLAANYLEAIADGKTALVVSPTHLEGEWITDEVREGLKQSGKLGGGERSVPTLENSNLTEAERRDAVNYAPGDVLVFHQNARGFHRGQRVLVGAGPLPLDHADKFQVFRPGWLPVAPGEIIRITRNGTTADSEHRLNNGALYTVAGFTTSGDIRLSNGWVVAADYGHVAHGYVVTSHASQGKTVDRVFIGQACESLPASSSEQFYVSVSRARERATIYTDDKASLLRAVSRSDERLAAADVIDLCALRDRGAAINRAVNARVSPSRAEERALAYDR